MFGKCGNIAYAVQGFEPATGKHSLDYRTTYAEARGEDGLCGPEALLFESKPPAEIVARKVGNAVRTVVAYAFAVSMALLILYSELSSG